MKNSIKKSKTYDYKIPDFIRQAILAWLVAVTIETGLLPEEMRNLTILDGIAQMSFLRVIVMACILGAVVFGISHMWNTILFERLGIGAAFCVLTLLFLKTSYTKEFMIVCLLILIGLTVFVIYGWESAVPVSTSPANGDEAVSETPGESKKNKKGKKNKFFWITAAVSALLFLLVCGWTVARVCSFSTPTYDFGIFSQMFYYMKESGLPMTTVERDGLLSHFHVHVSPIYYLLLPFYLLVPKPAMLQVLQAAVIVSAVIPLWKIGKHHGLSDMQCMFGCLILLLFPAFLGGAGYDIHENCFLTPLILWLFYGLDKEKLSITLPAAVLTLMVKEDAAVYVAVIALWFLVKNLVSSNKDKRRNLITALGLLILSVGWFFFVTNYLAEIGDGVMTYRYNNFIYDGSGSLMSVIKAVILNPMKAVFECVDTEKQKYIVLTLLPIMGMPFCTRKYERYILLIPYLLVNLMSDYTYQHELFFQYNFGSTAFLMYLLIVNLADWKKEKTRNFLGIASTILCAMFFSVTVLPKAELYITRAVRYDEYYDNIRSVLSVVPDDAEVTASTFYTTELSQREILYDIRYSSTEHLLETEYVVLDPRTASDFKKYATDGEENGYENLVRLLEENGYEKFEYIEGILEIYLRKR